MSLEGQKNVSLGQRWDDDPSHPDVVWMFPGNHRSSGAPNGTEGGVVVDPESRDVFCVKHPVYRLLEVRGQAGVHDADIFPLEGYRAKDSSDQQPKMMGIEEELMAIDEKTGTPYPLWTPDGRAVNSDLSELIGEHPELFPFTAEIDDGPHSSVESVKKGLFRKFVKLHKALPEGVGVDPASAWMGKALEVNDITPNPYVQVMVDNLGGEIMNFVGHAVHEHYDVDPEAIHVVSRYLQLVAPIMNAGLQSAPYMHDRLQPEMSDIFSGHTDISSLIEIEEESDGNRWYSVRYPTRYFASTEGGVAKNMDFPTKESLLFEADKRLQIGEVNNVSRVNGPHSDVRPRYDLAPGRVELCVRDNPLGRVETTAAYSELSWQFVRAIERIALSDDVSILEKLHADYGDLFGKHVNPSEMTGILERTHRNSLRIAKDGPSVEIEDGFGEYKTVNQQMRRLLDFLDEYGYGVSLESKMTISNSLASRSVPSNWGFDEYYRTGIGTPADYHHRLADRMVNHDMSESDIIRELSIQRVGSFATYLGLK